MDLFQQCATPWALLINFFSNHTCQEIYESGLPTDMYSFGAYLPFFLKTILLEFPIYFLFLRKAQSLPRLLLITLILNLATHPILFMVMPIVFSKFNLNYRQYLCIAEIFAPVIEGLLLKYYYQQSTRTSFWAALLANLFSWSVGIFWS